MGWYDAGNIDMSIEHELEQKPDQLSWRIKAVIFSVVIGILLYVGASVYAGRAAVWTVMQKIGWTGLIISLLLSLLNYLLRFFRWQLYLRYLNYSVPSMFSWRIYLAGFALTTTPGKAGEGIRCFFLRQKGVPISSSLAALVSERFSDLLGIVALSCIGLWNFPQARLPILITIMLILLFLLVLFYPPVVNLIRKKIQCTESKHQWLFHVLEIIQQVRLCHSPAIVFLSSIVSILAWGCEAVAFYLVLYWAGFGDYSSFTFAIFVYSLSVLIGALSFLPGGLGGAEGAMISLLIVRGIDMPAAIALTVFIRMTTLWFAVAIGILALFRSYREPKDE